MSKHETTILVGTNNSLKTSAVGSAFATLLPDHTISVKSIDCESGVPATPWEEDTKLGAINRAKRCRSTDNSPTFCVGVESGLTTRYGDIYEEAWACVIDETDAQHLGYSSGLKLPSIVTDIMLNSGKTHAQAMKELQGRHMLVAGDTWGNYTSDTLSRANSIEEAVRNALVQIISPEKSLFKQTQQLPGHGHEQQERPQKHHESTADQP